MTKREQSRNLVNSLTNVHEELSIEQLELYQAFIAKSLEFRKAEEALLSSITREEGGDEQTTDILRSIRHILDEPSYRLSGNDCVLLACYFKLLEEEEHLETKRINIFLHSYDRKPANTTKIVDQLEKKKLIKISSDGLHAHKSYQLTSHGKNAAQDLIQRLNNENGNEKLAVIS